MHFGRTSSTVAALALLLAYTIPAMAAEPENEVGVPLRSDVAPVYDADHLNDGAFLRGWLICGPFPNPGNTDSTGACVHDGSCVGFFTDFLAPSGGESAIAPQADLQVLGPDQKTRRWNAVSTLGGRVYFDEYLSPSEFQTGYAACWINATKDEDRLFGVGGDDGMRIWVNGEEIFRYHASRILTPDEHYIRFPLKAGRNLVLIKLDNGTGRWGFSIRPVDNASAVKETIDRLRKVLRFDFRLGEQGFELTLGDPLTLGNLWDLPEGEIRVMNRNGDTVHTFTTPLCRPVLLPYADFSEEVYLLEAKVLWPYRGRILIPGMIHRGNLRADVQAMVAGEPPDLPPGLAAEAYRNLLDSVHQRDQFNGFAGEPYAYYRLKAGLTQALQFAINLQNNASPYDRIFPRPRQAGRSGHAPVTITGHWTLDCAESIFDDALDAHFIRRWTELTSDLGGEAEGSVRVMALESGFLNVPAPELESGATAFVEAAAAIRESVPADPEGYAILVTADGIIVAGRTAAGANYGLDTLLQLLSGASKSEERTLILDGGTIIDAPVYRTRASLLPLEQFDDGFKSAIDGLAELRFNHVFLPSSHYTALDDAEVRATLVDAYAYCRARFVEPVPLIESFGADSVVAGLDPNLLEGTYVEEFPAVVDELRRVHLPYDRILDCASSRPRVRTAKGYAVLRQDRDYVFESYAPPVLQLKGQAPVQTGDTLLITADLVDLSQANTPACCPSDTNTWLLLEKLMAEVYTHLKPRAIHLGHSGAGYLNRDSRCIERGMPNDLILADAVQKGTDIVRNLDRKADVFIWGEHFNPLDRAIELDGVKGAQQLPKDITVVDLHIEGASWYDLWRIDEGLSFFDQFGVDTLGVVRSDPLAAARYAAMKREHPQRFRGVLHYPVPGDAGGQFAAAQAGWEATTLLGSLDTDAAARTDVAR
ncbi:MAG: hypothetical protein JNK74_13650 [Candidatus Hydrogenedentes bacterium]|nr:hypothetical protein [Candidatus Hydrogenedentota bacterium]